MALKPSHRVSVMHYRNTGIVLPFGESIARYTAPNRLFYTSGGQWLQNDSAMPLFCWEYMLKYFFASM